MIESRDPVATSDLQTRNTEFWNNLADANPDAVIFDGPGPDNLFDDCIIGYATRINFPPVLVYDEEQMIDTLATAENLEYPEAHEYLSFNTFGAWLGDGTPLILTRKHPHD